MTRPLRARRPSLTDGGLFGWIGLYLLLVLAIGLWSIRRTRDARDFFLAGQRLGLWVTALTTMSAAFSGFVFLGGPGLMYRDGVGALFICAPIGVTPALLGWLLAVRLRLFAEVPGVLTLPDVIERRFASRGATAGAALAILLGSVAYLAAQLLALGVLLAALLELPVAAAIILGLAVVLSYSVAGGMVAGVWTDLAQGLLMLAAAAAVFWLVASAEGGLGGLVSSIAASEAFGEDFFRVGGADGWMAAASLYLVFSVGTLAQPQMLHKLMMVRNLERLRWLPLTLGGAQTACLLVWLGLGLAVPAAVARGVMGAVESPDRAVPEFLLAFVPPWLQGLLAVAVVAAIMSTADSFLNLAAGAARRDLPRCLGRAPVEGGRAEVRRLRRATLWIGLASAALALLYGDLIALLGTFAFGLFAAGLVPALAVGLNTRRVTPRAATLSIWTGLTSALALELLRRWGAGWWDALGLPAGLLPSALALLVSLLVLLVASLLDRRTVRLDRLTERILSL